MKKFSLLLQIVALTAGLPAFAITGGPFDNGSYSILDERNGVYEAAYTFKNGSGYSQWTADNSQGDSAGQGTFTPNIGAGSLLTASGSTSNANRTVLYYKGVTYFGSAFGQVDTTKRTIQGFGNATSDFSTATTTTTQQQGIFTTASSSAFSTNTVVSSGRNYSANLNWTGKITETTPQLRFTGTGELGIIAPNGSEAIASLAYTGYQNLIDAISRSVSSSGGAFSQPDYPGAAAAIAGILNGSGSTPTIITPAAYAQAVGADGLTRVDVNGDGIFNNDLVPTGAIVQAATVGTPSLASYLDGTGPDNSYEEATVEKIKVSGYRRYF